MNNYYEEKMQQLETKYQGKFKKIIDELKIGAKEAARLREDLKNEELIYYLGEANNQTKKLRADYIEKCKGILEEALPIPSATKYNELDLRLMKLNMLAKEDKENINSLKEILNQDDFNINKGQLMEIALLKADKDLLKQVTSVKKIDSEFIKGQAQYKLNQIINNQNSIPGIEIPTKMAINKTGITDYFERVANSVTTNSF